MPSITIQKTLRRGSGGDVVIANDSANRCFMGLGSGQGGAGGFHFVEIDRVTLIELERGTTDAVTVMRDRCAGIVVLPSAQ